MPDFDALCRKALTDPSAALTLREAHLRRATLGALVLPGLTCRLAGSALIAPVALTALVDLAREAGLAAHRHGPVVWMAGGPELPAKLLSTLRAELPGHLRPAAVIGLGEIIVGPRADLHGVEVERVRTLTRHARATELLCTPAAAEGVDAPEGVGCFGAPQAVAKAVGHDVTIWRDYR